MNEKTAGIQDARAEDGATSINGAQPASRLSFEEALRQLDEVVRTLEAGNAPLEQSLELSQRGMALAAQCDATLAQAEAILEQLVMTLDGELAAQRVAWDDEDDEDDAVSEDA